MTIKPDYISFGKMLHERLFRVPNYQRHYSWGKKQRSDLFGDILNISKYPERNHFMATMVCLYKNETECVGSDQYAYLDIVDGQQRITSLIILLKMIGIYLAKGDPAEREEGSKLNELLVKKDKRLILLQTNHDNTKIFSNFLIKSEFPHKRDIEYLADLNFYSAIKESEKFVKQWKSEHKKSLIDLLSILKNRLYFILQILEDHTSVYSVFEVLNSRGLEVDWLDKCKSMLMGLVAENANENASKEHIGEMHKIWSAIYRTIGIKSVSGFEIITFAATLNDKNVTAKALNTQESLDYFKEICSTYDKGTNLKKISDITDWILKVTTVLVELNKNPKLKAVTRITHARLLAISIILRDDLDGFLKEKCLDQWERMTFKIFGILRKDSRFKRGDYIRCAQNIFHKKFSKDEILDELKEISNEYDIDEAIEKREGENCYDGWEEELRYFFYKLEESKAEHNGGKINPSIWNSIWSENASNSIEHIVPKGDNTCSLKQWRGKIRSNIFKKHVHRIGNLVLLPPGANSQAGQKSFAEKKVIYHGNWMYIMQDILKQEDWNKASIDAREEELLKWARTAWSDVE